MKEISKKQLEELNKKYRENPQNKIIRHSLSKTGIEQVASSLDGEASMAFNFDIVVKTLDVTNQKASGRCWLFAATNVLREKIAKDLNLDHFELSQSFLAFYDKFEKINYTLEAFIENIDADYDDRTLTFLLQNVVGDGGQWDMFVNLVNKYGLMPKQAYGETFTSSNTRYINSLINAELRKFAANMKNIKDAKGLDEVYRVKNDLLTRCYEALVNAYGEVPETFDFEYVDKDGKYHLDRNLTPLTFKEKYIGNYLDDFVSIIDAPTSSKKMNTTYTVKYLGNVVGGKIVTHLNVGIERLKELVIKQLKDNEIVWFGSDVAFYGDRQGGVWDDGAFDFESLLKLDYKIDKGLALDFRISQMNHAMCITGVSLLDNVPTKWKIENSWGDQNGVRGYYIMSASWFDRYTYQAVVHKKYLNEEELKALEKAPIVLKPWDPMGSLAD